MDKVFGLSLSFFLKKNQFIFDIDNWLWKYTFGTFWQTIIYCRIILRMLIVGQKSCILRPTIFKFHNRTDINMYSITLVLQVKMPNICIAYYIIYIGLFVHDLQYKSVYNVHWTRICRFYWIILKGNDRPWKKLLC